MKAFLLPLAVLTLMSNVAFAGSAESTIECKSASGRTKFSAASQDMYTVATSMTLEIDGKQLSFEQGLTLYEIRDGVIVASGSNADYTSVQMTSIPNTVKNKSRGESVDVDFKARVRGSDPRDPRKQSPEIVVDCKLHYSI